MKVYIAGPMTGLPDFNYPAFFAAERALRAAGFEPINPARDEGREGCKSWLDFMRAALHDVAEADGIALLDGWFNSRGASIEHDLGKSLGLDVRRLDDWKRVTLADVERARTDPLAMGLELTGAPNLAAERRRRVERGVK